MQLASTGTKLFLQPASGAGVVLDLTRQDQHNLRPPVTPDRLTLTADGQVRLELRHPWADGTTHLLFDPVEFLGRLAVLPRIVQNLIRHS